MSRAPQYARPRTLDDAIELLDNLGAGASVIAGGQELMPSMNHGVFEPAVLVDVNALRELAGIREDGDALSIGALCTHREIERNERVRTHAPLLASALATIGGGWQVRNRGTLGGNIVSAHPLYDSLPPLIALGARVQIRSGAHTRSRMLSEVMRDAQHGLGTTAILTRIQLPLDRPGPGWAYEKLKNTHGAYASANCAAVVRLDDAARVAHVRLVVGAVEDLPVDMSETLSGLVGRTVSEALLHEVARLCATAVAKPLSDQRGDAEYRCAMAGVVARRAFETAAARARTLTSQFA
jgi:carbon-monoxide dehydrogenase medium subunit/2-furoyl-CoA dehydrogenase FAD binding subunit